MVSLELHIGDSVLHRSAAIIRPLISAKSHDLARVRKFFHSMIDTLEN